MNFKEHRLEFCVSITEYIIWDLTVQASHMHILLPNMCHLHSWPSSWYFQEAYGFSDTVKVTDILEWARSCGWVNDLRVT